MKRVAVVGVPGGWSSEQLANRFGELTGFRALVDPAEIRLDITEGKAFFHDLELTALDGLAIKKVGPAYSHRLLDRLDAIRFIAAGGVKVFSKPENISRVINRLSCTISMARAGIPMPPTVVTEELGEAVDAVKRFGRVVLKPLYTSKARGMVVVEDGPDAPEQVRNYQDSGNTIIYIQKMVDIPGHDLGLTFLGGEYLATYARVGQKGVWNTTTVNGGRYQSYEPSQDIIDLAYRAQNIFNLDFTCVDVVETDQGPLVFEVSAFGGFKGLRDACGFAADKAYAEYILRELSR